MARGRARQQGRAEEEEEEVDFFARQSALEVAPQILVDETSRAEPNLEEREARVSAGVLSALGGAGVMPLFDGYADFRLFIHSPEP